MIRPIPLVGPHVVDKVSHSVIITSRVICSCIDAHHSTPVSPDGMIQNNEKFRVEWPLPWARVLVRKAISPDSINVEINPIVPPLYRVGMIAILQASDPTTPAIIRAQKEVVILGVRIDVRNIIVPPHILENINFP